MEIFLLLLLYPQESFHVLKLSEAGGGNFSLLLYPQESFHAEAPGGGW